MFFTPWIKHLRTINNIIMDTICFIQYPISVTFKYSAVSQCLIGDKCHVLSLLSSTMDLKWNNHSQAKVLTLNFKGARVFISTLGNFKTMQQDNDAKHTARVSTDILVSHLILVQLNIHYSCWRPDFGQKFTDTSKKAAMYDAVN